MELDSRLRQQLDDRISLILQATNNYNLNGLTETQQAQFEKQTILQKVGQEIEYLDGVEVVYRSLLNRQTITALEN